MKKYYNNFMNYFVKFIFTILGGGLVGFGLGVMAHKNSIMAPNYFEVAIVMSLVAGGFFLALGIPGRRTRVDEPIPPAGSNPPSQS